MKEFIMNNTLIIVAIISFAGVSLAACLSYLSNIKTNKQKLKHEEDKLKRAFIQTSFDRLVEASATLRARGIAGYKYEEVPSCIDEHINVFNSIKPYILKENIAVLENIVQPTLSAFYGGKDADFRKNGAKLLENLPKIIDDEILRLSGILRDFAS